MRDFFESNSFRHGTSNFWPLLIGAGLSAAGGIMSGMSQKKSAKKAQQAASIQSSRDIGNQFMVNDLQRQQMKDEMKLQDLGRVDSSFGGARGGYMFGDEFLSEADARDRGLIKDTNELAMFASSGENQFTPYTRTRVDPRLQKTTRTRLSPELESIRQQALGFQNTAGDFLQGGFQGIDTGYAQREMDLLNQLAAPREAQRREALFGMLQRTGQLGSTGGATIFRGAEEAAANEGLRRELSARDVARAERDKEYAANLDLFGLGNRTTNDLFNIEQGLTNRLISTSRGAPVLQQQPINVASLQHSPSEFPQGPGTGAMIGSALSGLGGAIAGGGGGMGGMFGSLFGGSGASGGGGAYLASQDPYAPRLGAPLGASKADMLFGSFGGR